MTRAHNAVREFVIPVGVAALAVVPALFLRVTGGSVGALGDMTLFGVAILAAGFLLSWGAEAAEKYVSTGFVLAIVALITVLPEYAVDFYYAYRAGHDPASGYVAYAAANMTGANRLLIGLAWPLLVGLHWWRSRQRGITLQDENAVEIGSLALASLYAFVIVFKGSIGLIDFIALLVLYGFFRRDIPRHYCLDELPEPRKAIRDPLTFAVGWGVLVLLLTGLFALEPMGIPVSVIAAVCAALLFAVAARGHIISTRRVLREAPWQVVTFSLGMYLVVYGMKNAGLTTYLTMALNHMAEFGLWGATLSTGLLAALLSSVMNNMPAVLLGALSIQDTQASGVIREAMIYANVIGSDLGPKITPIGSLATLLWLHVLARKGIRITWGYYFKTGVILTLPILLVTLCALALRLSV